MIPLILEYLQSVAGSYDYLPTKANAEYLFALGVVWAEVEEPVVLAEEWEWIVGWTSWVPVVSETVEYVANICIGMGTYVTPEYRGKGLAKQLHDEATRLALAKGHTRVDRIAAMGHEGEKMLLREGWKPVAIVYQKELRDVQE